MMMCAACNVNIASDPRAHVLSDNHVKNVAKFPGSDRYKSHILKFKYCCDSCSFSFTTFNNLTGHSNCPKLKFRYKRSSEAVLCVHVSAAGVSLVTTAATHQSLPIISGQEATAPRWPP